MNVPGILDRITARRTELGLSEAAVASHGGSRDLIRNWRRAAQSGTTIKPRLDSLEAIALALGVSLEWLLHGGAEPRPHATPPAGLQEAVTPYRLQQHGTQGAMPELAALFGPAANTPATYRINVPMPDFQLAAGDVLVVDLARLPEPGELTLVTFTDETTASGTSTVCRYLPPYLWPGEPQQAALPLRLDNPQVTVRYPVIGSMRGLLPA
ncbi:helix-turn-helix domain-containing protein [Paragemmobacter ruber]|uniref:HTH cro/C1-type domain-containing protein n=1 Tax=Paragemmobacter ruber TaxID=1985673 RepID=A0ABW9Y140_9RHOB|nr:helix-turn-helix transcriptional regulator [Rhodobacter ruber]NBE05954.1 hypothetical protein [Rhodobacter ruber]